MQQCASHRAQHERAQRIGLARGHDREAVRGNAGRRERAMVATEDRNAAYLMPPFVAAQSEVAEHAADVAEKRRLVAGVPHHEAVADAAQLEAQDPDHARGCDVADVGAGAEVPELFARGEEHPHP